MRWTACGLLALFACGTEAGPGGFDTLRAAVEALREAYDARDGEAFSPASIPPATVRRWSRRTFGFRSFSAGSPKIELDRANLGRLFEIFDELEVASDVFASMPGGLAAFERADPTFVYGLLFPGPWRFERIVAQEDDTALAQVHQRSRGHDIRVILPLREIGGRWYAVAPPLDRPLR